MGGLARVAYPSLDTTRAVSVSVGQSVLGSAGQDEEVALPSQKWPSLAFKVDRWIGKPSLRARRTKGALELDWRGETGMAEERKGRRARTTMGYMIVGMEWRAAVVGGW